MPYTIEAHQHRFAAWVAATAAGTSPLCRFKVGTGVAILEASDFDADLATPEQLPRPQDIDKVHRQWRDKAIAEARRRKVSFTHGVAAKLINCYLKVRFVCGGMHARPRVGCLHPPIDAVLLNGLAKNDVGGFRSDWRRFHDARWSRFDSQQYQEVIDLIRRALPGRPLWEVEKYWPGHQ